jgi:uncharacterized repeat protein (TIGR01451 family)
VDAAGNAYVTGGTSSANFPAVNSFGPFTSQHYTTFVTELAPSGTALVYSTALPDGGTNIAVDTLRDIYVVGSTGGGFVAKIGPASTAADLTLTGTVSPNPVQTGDQFTYTVVVTNSGPDDAPDVTVSTSASSHAVSFISASPTQGTCQGVTCALGTVPSGGAATVAVVGAAGAGGAFTLTSLVSSGVGDPNVANNVAKVGLTAIAHAGGYIFTTIDVPGAISSTDANGINSGGSVVGEYTDAGGTLHGFLLRNGAFTFINAPKVLGTVTGGINDRGQIVGSEFGSTTSKGFLQLPQAPRLFIPFGARWSPITFAFGISAKAKIVGGFLNPSRTFFHGFLLNQGRLTHIDVAGSPTGAVAFGVNDSAQVVGSYGNLFGGQRHGFLWYNGHITSIDVPGASSTSANGINEGGQIVGAFSDARGTHGFILDQGAFTTIDIPGASTNILGINAVGDIVGIMTDGVGDHGFVGWKQ